MKIETLAIRAGHEADRATGAINQPIYLSSTFERDTDGGYSRGFEYARTGNPNRQALERCMAVLEGGDLAFSFSSGMAAISAVLQTLAPGDHVVFPHDMYFGTKHLLEAVWKRWHLSWTVVDMTDVDAVRSAMRKSTKVVWTESPSNPLITIIDLASVSEIAHESGAICVCDNTLATPVLQNPITLGVDAVVHSTTKYINGHSDIVGGCVVLAKNGKLAHSLAEIQQEGGAVPSPFDCWMTLRGIQTLPHRMRAHCENAQVVAAWLDRHSSVETVYFPGLEQHPGHRIAASQMSGFGAMMSILVKGGYEQAMEVAANLALFTRATSLGGTHSLVEHRGSMEGEGTLAPPNLLRLSIGLEHSDDLIDDLDSALGKLMRDSAG